MDRDLDLSLLRTFFTVAMTGSFTATGHRLFRTQPAISLRIKRLEEMIGSPLIARSPEGVTLTREGSLLLGYAERILALNDEMMDRIRTEGAREVVRLGLPFEYGAVALEGILRSFAEDCPQASLTVESRTSADLDERLRQGRLDVILRIGPEGSARYRVPLVWLAAAAPDTATPLRLVLPEDGNLYRQIALSVLNGGARPFDIVCTTGSWEATRSAVQAGLGITLAARDMAAEGLRTVIDAGLPGLPVLAAGAVHRPGLPSQAIRRLCELLDAGLGRR